jgi:hypothetical protein
LPSDLNQPNIVSPYNRPDDAFGYAVYSVVIMASIGQQAKIQSVRDAVKYQRSMIPGHITVKGTFCDIESLNGIIERIRDVADKTAPFYAVFKGVDESDLDNRYERKGSSYAGQLIEKTPDLVALHDALYDSLSPVTTNAYAREDGDHYHPHLAIYAEAAPGLEEVADEQLNNLDIGKALTCDSMFLMGHIGPPYRGRWTIVREFLLNG